MFIPGRLRNKLWKPETTSNKYPHKAGAGNVKILDSQGNIKKILPIEVIFPEKNIKTQKSITDDMPKGMSSRETDRYFKWRRKILIRDKNTCCLCQAKDWIQVHHIIRWIDDEALRYDLRNGVCLCLVCHQKHHGPQMQPFGKAVTDKLNDYVNQYYRMRPLKNADYIIGD